MKPRTPLSFLPVSMGFVVLVLALTLTVLKVNTRTNPASFSINTQAADTDPVVYLSPEKGTYQIKPIKLEQEEDFYTVGVLVDSLDKKVSSVSVKISFDPQIVEVSPKVAITNILDKEMAGNVDLKQGIITISGSLHTEKQFAGLLGTFTFKPKKPGDVRFSLDANISSTTGVVKTKVIDSVYKFTR